MKHFILKASIILLTLNATAQIGIGTANPAATLDVVSNRSGFLMPRNADHTTIKKLDGITALDNLDAGMQVFNTTTQNIMLWNGTSWVIISEIDKSGVQWFFDAGLGNAHASAATYVGNATYENTGNNSRGIRLATATSQVGTAYWNVTNFDFTQDFRLEFRVFIDVGGDDFTISLGGAGTNDGYTLAYNTLNDIQSLFLGTSVLKSSASANLSTGSLEGDWVTGRLEVFRDKFSGKKYIRSSYLIQQDWVTALVAEITTDILPNNTIKFFGWGGSNGFAAGFFVQNAILTYL